MKHRARKVNGLSFACATLVTLASPALLAAAPDWSTHNGNAAHTGYVPITVRAEDLAVRWTAKMPGSNWALNQIATGGGMAFASQDVWYDAAWLAAIDLADGHFRWTREFTGVAGAQQSLHAPAYRNGAVYVTTGGDDGALWRFDAATGASGFRSPIANQAETYLAPVPVGNAVYTEAGEFGGVQAFNAGTGASMWSQALAQVDGWTPAVDDRYVYAYTDKLDVFDRKTGQPAYSISLGGVGGSSPFLGAAPVLGSMNDAIVACGGGCLASFDLAGRTVRWRAAGRHWQPSIADGKVYAARDDRFVDVLDEATGALLQTWTLPNTEPNITSDVLLTKNMMFVSGTWNTYAVRRTALKGSVWHLPVVGKLSMSGDGVLLIAGDSGTVTAVAVPAP